MAKYKVTVQYRSVRTINVAAKDKHDAIEKAAEWMERDGCEVIACSAEPAEA